NSGHEDAKYRFCIHCGLSTRKVATDSWLVVGGERVIYCLRGCEFTGSRDLSYWNGTDYCDKCLNNLVPDFSDFPFHLSKSRRPTSAFVERSANALQHSQVAEPT